MKKYMIFLIGLFIFLTCSCISNETIKYKFFYFDVTKNELVTHEVNIDSVNNNREEIIYLLTEALYKKIDVTSKAKISSVPTIITLNNDIAHLNFDSSFHNLTIIEQLLTRVALVYTLTNLDFISGIEISIDNTPITTKNGVAIGIMNKENIILNLVSPNPPTSYQTLKLYFLDKTTNKLVPETRGIEVNKDFPIEKYIIQELIKGPTSDKLLPILPADTIINYIATKNGVCQVDLSSGSSFKEILARDGEKMLVEAVVNSLTEIYYIQKVGLLIDGKRELDSLGIIDLNLLFGRNESVIAK
ncbi:hypothetical protein AN641_01285 [Candidatus Epulonipiscioides gigas]|nr:hypothetical protein AN641_01285 [Epulopiscium sp. SCG-C07WGA-EpuloA2]